jgi:hypothetical protein
VLPAGGLPRYAPPALQQHDSTARSGLHRLLHAVGMLLVLGKQAAFAQRV